MSPALPASSVFWLCLIRIKWWERLGRLNQRNKESSGFQLPNCVPAFAESISMSCIKLLGCFVEQDGCLFRETPLLPLIHVDFGPPCGPEGLCLSWAHDARWASEKVGFQAGTHRWRRRQFCLFSRLPCSPPPFAVQYLFRVFKHGW